MVIFILPRHMLLNTCCIGIVCCYCKFFESVISIRNRTLIKGIQLGNFTKQTYPCSQPPDQLLGEVSGDNKEKPGSSPSVSSPPRGTTVPLPNITDYLHL